MKRSDLAAATGVAAPAVLLLTVGVGVASSPTYDWPAEPFSALGASGEPTADWFAAGLVLTGLLTLPFAARLWRVRAAPVGGLYALVGLSLVGAGLFPFRSLWHEVFGAGSLLGIWLLLWVAAVVDWRAGSHRDAVLALVLGTASLAVWLPYDLGIESAQLGYGLAELVAFLAFAAWSARSAVRIRARNAGTPPESRPETPGSEEPAR